MSKTVAPAAPAGPSTAVMREPSLEKARSALQAVTRIAAGPKLTKRETEIIRLVDKGVSDRAIAGRLGIAVPTVRRHLENIFAKLNTRSRGAAAAIWRNLP